MKSFAGLALILGVMSLTACAPEVGSEGWCKALKEKPKGEWTLDETRDYTKGCLF